MGEFTFVADTKIDDVWFNQSLSLFAVVPDAPDQDVDATAAIVDELVRSYREASEKQVRETPTEVLAELHELHARQMVLWPLGVQWEQSVLGKVNGVRFNNMVQEADPRVLNYREEIENSQAFRNAGYPESVAKDRSQELWRVFITLRLATIGLNDLMEVSQEHLFALVNTARIDGVWAEWATGTVRRTKLRFARFLSSFFSDPMFGVGILNPPRRLKVGPRVPPLVLSHPHLTWVQEAFETWLDESVAKTKKNGRLALKLLADLMRTLPPETTAPEQLFSRAKVKELLAFAVTWGTPFTRCVAMSKLMDFAEWYCLDYSMRQGPPGIKLEWNRYDLELFLKAAPREPGRTAEVAARPMPTRYHRMLKRIIMEDDFAWPKSVMHGMTGKPVHWFAWTNPETGKIEQVFCEVLPRLLLLLLELPLRNIQARRLDSGEGDDREYDVVSRTWSDARGPLARHWTTARAKNARRGVFREIVTDIGTIAGFWINSNKTQDLANLFDETSGYEIPWQHDELIENLAAMRKWQETYNPVSEPLAYADLPLSVFKGEEPSRAVRAVLPAQFYLFRYPQNVGHPRGREAPPSYYVMWQFFLDALDELEKRLRAEDPDSAVRIITQRNSAGQPSAAIFTIHGMRASTLTALHLAGVPIGVLSKLVAGHASILMTLYYTKFGPAHVNEILNDARTRALLDSKAQFANFLRSATIQEAMRMTARLADDGVHQMKGTYEETAFWSRMDIGICPNGGTLCHIGGEVLQSRKEKNGRNKSIYQQVPGGPRNCVRCRFFVTGLPFLIPLWAHAAAILAKVGSVSKRIDSVSDENVTLKRERWSLGRDAPQSLTDRINVLDELFTAESDARNQALANSHATMFLLEKVRAIAGAADLDDEAKLPMLLGEDGVPQISARESTRFEVVDAVVQASRWFPSIASAELEAERDEFLNQVLHRNGYVPITLSPLTAQERRKAADALAEMLLVELGATEAQNVIDGRRTLADLGLQDKLERTAAAAIGHPIERLVLLSPPKTPIVEAAAE